jgi:hypothetical protein
MDPSADHALHVPREKLRDGKARRFDAPYVTHEGREGVTTVVLGCDLN